MSITDDDEHVLSAGDALREAEVAAAGSAADTDIFVRGASDTQIESDPSEPAPASSEEYTMVAGSTEQEFTRNDLRHLSIDDLRELACTLQIPDRSRTVDKDELIDEICKRF